MSFSAKIEKDKGILYVLLTGSLVNKEQVGDLLNELEFEFDQGVNQVIINLSEMDFMNSTGLNVLINILTLARNNGGEVLIAAVPEKIAELLVITKLDSVFDIVNTIEEATRRFDIKQ